MGKLPADYEARRVPLLPSNSRKVRGILSLQPFILEPNSLAGPQGAQSRQSKRSKTVDVTLCRYQLALAQNPRSITLWKNYLSWLKKEICKSDPGYLKKEHDKAIKIIGNHFKAGFIFEAAFNLEPSPAAKYLILKKGLVSPLKEIDLIYDLAASWLDSSDLPLSDLVAIAQQEGVTAENEADLRQQLKSALRRFY